MDAVVGAVIVGAVAILLAAIVSLTSGTTPTTISPWPGDIRREATEPQQLPSIEFRDGERQMLPAEQRVLEEKALIDFRQAERESR